jgi:lipoprotein-anchoring transpeptidase ErfK/SrfK
VITVLALAALAIVGTIAITATRDDAPPAAVAQVVSTTTTTTTPPTTVVTTTEPPVDHSATQVATSRLTTLTVADAPPPEAVALPGEAEAGRALHASFAEYTPERAGAPAIPNLRAPVEGRRRTIAGWEFDNPTPWGNPLTLAVTGRQGSWLRVQIPARPNGAEGWVREADVTLTSVRTRVEISIGARTLRAYDGPTFIAETKVVVGKGTTPTPTGRYFVTDYEKKARGSAYGPWILPLSGYSQALDSFSGGVPVIAMHGTNHPELAGRAASNGCVRMPDDVIEVLRTHLPLGTPVDIRP